MKTRILRKWTAGLLVTGLPFVQGCKDGASVASANAQAPQVTEKNDTSRLAEDASAEETSAANPETGIAEEVEPAQPAAAKPLPSNLKVTQNSAEVVKLAQAGVDDSVLLSFVTNSTGTFNLGSEEIIYLNDLGVSSSVVTAMITHDRPLGIALQNAVTPNPPATPVPAEIPPDASSPPENQPAAAPTYVSEYTAPAQPVTYSSFYSSLSPYGSWVQVDGYGMCWQPTAVVVNPGWRPYCDRGRWIYTDCGWYWLSDYSWGCDTFHYGRWFHHARWGWCWYPDTVWAPAWVTWRYSNDYCGWAPLPPRASYRSGFGFTYYDRSVSLSFDFGLRSDCYTFIPFNRFCDYHPYRYALPHHSVTKIYNRTTIVNNFAAGSDNTVINAGIAPERVAAATRTQVRKVAVREAPTAITTTKTGRAERLEREGDRLVVYRPRTTHTPISRTLASTEGTRTESQNQKAVLPRVRTTDSSHSEQPDQSRPSRQQTVEKSDVVKHKPPAPIFTRQDNRIDDLVKQERDGRKSDKEQPNKENLPATAPAAIRKVERPSAPLVKETTTASTTFSRNQSPEKSARETTPKNSVIIIGKRNEKVEKNEQPNSASVRSEGPSPSVNNSTRATAGYQPLSRQSYQAPSQVPTTTRSVTRAERDDSRVLRQTPSISRREAAPTFRSQPSASQLPVQPQIVVPAPVRSPAVPQRPQYNSTPAPHSPSAVPQSQSNVRESRPVVTAPVSPGSQRYSVPARQKNRDEP